MIIYRNDIGLWIKEDCIYRFDTAHRKNHIALYPYRIKWDGSIRKMPFIECDVRSDLEDIKKELINAGFKPSTQTVREFYR